jgi:rubrerythrin
MKLDEAIKIALEYEVGVHGIYLEAIDKTADPDGQRIFKVLCDEEMGHVAYLKNRLEEWERTGKIVVKKLGTSIPEKKP